MTNPHIELVKKYLANTKSVSLRELKDNKDAAYAAYAAANAADTAYYDYVAADIAADYTADVANGIAARACTFGAAAYAYDAAYHDCVADDVESTYATDVAARSWPFDSAVAARNAADRNVKHYEELTSE